MNPASSRIEMKSWFARNRTRLGQFGRPGLRQWPGMRLLGPDSDKVVDRARRGAQAEPVFECGCDLSVRPAFLAKPADQFHIGLKLALGWEAIGRGEEIGYLVIEVHAHVAASTVRPCSGLFGKNSADIRQNPGLSGPCLFQRPNGPEYARTLFGSVRTCSAVRNRRTTYCVSNHNDEYGQCWQCNRKRS